MLRIILWSAEEQNKTGKLLADLIAQEANILPLVVSEQEALAEIAKVADRERAGDSTLLFINSQLPLEKEQIKEIIAQVESFSGDFASFPIDFGDSILSSPEAEAATLIQSFSAAQTWNTNVVIAKEYLTQEMSEDTSVPSALLKMAIRAMGESAEIDWNLRNIDLQNAGIQNPDSFETKFGNQQNSAFIQYSIASINIEELFPNHDWDDHEAESAAACYHALAARFIALDSIENAEECLQFGDRLEDSPRSLALKGLIALKQGEVLAAVANMVSSLQEYEKRKIEDTAHYLTFKPLNLEVINTSLQNGLSALNKRENDRAAEYFTDAVFNFDAFYQDCGLEQP